MKLTKIFSRKTIIASIVVVTLYVVLLGLMIITREVKVDAGQDYSIYRVGFQDMDGYKTATYWQEVIPEKILDTYFSEGLSVYYDGYFNYKGHPGTLGYIQYNAEGKVLGIHARNDGKYNPILDENINFTIAHEFGHYFDHIMGDLSATDEWVSITEKEAPLSQCWYIKTKDGTHYFADPLEFFAEECAYYFYGNDIGEYEKDCCPEAQAYVKAAIERYCEGD